MSYNPNNQYAGPQMFASAAGTMFDQKQKDREDAGLLAGFKKIYQSSPDLQQAFPVDDWGNVSPNQVRGLLQGMTQATQAQTMRFAEDDRALAQRQSAAQSQALASSMQGVQGDPIADYIRQSAAAGVPVDDNLVRTALVSQIEPKEYDFNGDGVPDMVLDPNRNLQKLPQAAQPPTFYTDPVDGTRYVFSGNTWQNATQKADYTPSELARMESFTEQMRRTENAINRKLEELSGTKRESKQLEIQATIKQLEQKRDDYIDLLSKLEKPAKRRAIPAEADVQSPAPASVAPAQQTAAEPRVDWGGAPVFASVAEAEASGYRGPAIIAGRKAMVE